ncbi:hypothetical protein ES703_80185 [subsurface metagenome]
MGYSSRQFQAGQLPSCKTPVGNNANIPKPFLRHLNQVVIGSDNLAQAALNTILDTNRSIAQVSYHAIPSWISPHHCILPELVLPRLLPRRGIIFNKLLVRFSADRLQAHLIIT